MIQNESWMILSNRYCCLKGWNIWSCWNTCTPETSLNTCVNRRPWCYSQIMGTDKNQLLRWYKMAYAKHNGEHYLLCWDMSRAVWQQYFWHSSSPFSLLWKSRKLSLQHCTFWAWSNTHRQKISISRQQARASGRPAFTQLLLQTSDRVQ